MSNELAREYAEATREKRDLEAKLGKVKKILAKIEPQLMEYMVQEGLPSIPITAPERDVQREAVNALLGIDVDDEEAIVGLLFDADLLRESMPEKNVTISIGSRVWASPVIDDPDRDKANDAEYARACDALEAEDFGEYSQRRFNVISLSSAVNELVQNGQIILEGNEGVAFNGTVRVIEKFALQARVS